MIEIPFNDRNRVPPARPDQTLLHLEISDAQARLAVAPPGQDLLLKSADLFQPVPGLHALVHPTGQFYMQSDHAKGGTLEQGLFDELHCDPDKMRKRTTANEITRQRQWMKAHAEEVLPALIAYEVGLIGRPVARGTRGADIVTEALVPMSGHQFDNISIKLLTPHSPLLHEDEEKRRRSLVKLSCFLEDDPANKALIVPVDVSKDRTAEALGGLVESLGSLRQIVILPNHLLHMAGVPLSVDAHGQVSSAPEILGNQYMFRCLRDLLAVPDWEKVIGSSELEQVLRNTFLLSGVKALETSLNNAKEMCK